jgi:hypothetical protein
MLGRTAARRRGGAEQGPNLLDMTPLREEPWEEDDDGIVTLLRERPRVRGPRSLGRWVSFMMAPPRIRLDDVGSFAWLGMDGETDVRDLAEAVRAEFGDRVEPVSQRLGHLIRVLRRERFIIYVERGDTRKRR